MFVSADGYAKGEHSGPYFDLGGPELERWIATHLAEPQVRDLVALGLVDRLRLIVFPVVLGAGGREPMFAGFRATQFELLASSVLDYRLVVLEYRPPHQL